MTATVHPFTPRKDRDLERARIAGEIAKAAARAAGKSGFQAAMAGAEAAMAAISPHNPATVINGKKERARAMIGCGPDHNEVRARYRHDAKIVRHHGLSLTLACEYVRLARIDKQRSDALRSAFGRRPPAIGMTVLNEEYLILRWLRRTKRHAEWPAILSTLCEPSPHMAMQEAAE